MENVFNKIDQKKFQDAINLIKEHISTKMDKKFIEDFVISLNILTENAMEVVDAVIPSLLSILNFDDDVVRYSMIISAEKFVVVHPQKILPYLKQYLNSGNAKDREGILFLMEYIANSQPKLLSDFFEPTIKLIGDSEEFVKKKAIDVLKKMGKCNRSLLEAKIIEFVKQNENPLIKDAADEVLKGLIDIKELEKEELEKMHEEAKEKVISEKEHEIQQKEQDIKKLELEKKELELQKKIEDEARHKELLEKEKKIHDEEQRLALEKLKLEEEQKQIEKLRIEEERKRLEKEKEVLLEQQKLALVKDELEKKRIEEEKAKIIAEEAARIQEKVAALQKEEDEDDDYEDI
jgi:hypothetical protein